MTPRLYRALVARLVIVAVAGLALGGLAVHASQTRPAPVVWTWTYES